MEVRNIVHLDDIWIYFSSEFSNDIKYIAIVNSDILVCWKAL